MYAIKFLSIIFDYAIAYFVAQIAFFVTKKENIRWLAFAIIPVIPTVIINGSLMSQCDVIYSTFVIGSVYFLLKNRLIASMIFLGIAFSLKAQTVMVLPFFFIFMLRGGIKWYYFLIIPVVYVVSVIPAWIAGYPFRDLILIYQMQMGGDAISAKQLVAFFPNIYVWIDHLLNYEVIYGLILTIGVTLVSGYVLSSKKYIFSLEAWIKLLFISVIVCPYLLPGMHERYMFTGDIVAGLYLLLFPRKAYLALGIILISFYSYIRCLYGVSIFYADSYGKPEEVFSFLEFIPWKLVFLVYTSVIFLVVWDFIKTLKGNKSEDEFKIGISEK